MPSRSPALHKSVHSPEQRQLGALLRDTRKKAGLNQQTVADRLEKPQSFVAKYEIGERRLDVLEFISVARALGADPLKLLRALMRNEK